MPWPTCKATFDSKKPCRACKTTWVKGEQIYKIEESYWCANPDCPKKKAETMKREEQSSSHTKAGGVVPQKLIDYHDNAWEIGLTKATKIYPPLITRFEGVEVDKNLRDRMILAQVYYKGLMGVQS